MRNMIAGLLCGTGNTPNGTPANGTPAAGMANGTPADANSGDLTAAARQVAAEPDAQHQL
ncbi:MAG: hypothetical protein JO280_11945 [Mycobacteriaceae bacterium]|nr:hypothetical protein [Mycobacteriaceae bacterium]